MEDSELLAKEIRQCRVCSDFLPLPPKPIFQFDPQARILLAGQAPGRVTDAKGRPFDDVSGDRLRDWMGIDRQTFYSPEKLAIIPMGFCYPGTGKQGDLPPREECAALWRQRLLDQLSELAVILVIGRYAMNWHLSISAKTTVTEQVSQWREYAAGSRPGPVIFPLPHPSPRNNRWLRNNPWFEQELLPEMRRHLSAFL